MLAHWFCCFSFLEVTMAEGEIKRSATVPRKAFALAVAAAKQDGSGIKGISARTGLKESSVNTRLANLRKQIGAENVPTFQGGGNRFTDEEKAEVIAILNPQPQQS